MTVDDFLHQLLALLPPGKAWTREGESDLTSLMDGIAPEFARVQERADALLLEIDPATVTEMIDEWESANGLPDDCASPLATIAARRAALLARLIELQGHNPADYAAIAVALGYASASATRRPFTAFAVNSPAGAPLYGEEWLFAFEFFYMANLIASTNDFTVWTNASASISANEVAGPGGGAINADEITFAASDPSTRTLAVAGAPGEVQFSVWLRSATSTIRQVQLVIIAVDGSTYSQTVSVDDRWTRYEFRAIDSSGIASVRLQRAGTGTYAVYAWGAYAGAVNRELECRIGKVMQGHTIALFRVISDKVSSLNGYNITLAPITCSASGTVA